MLNTIWGVVRDGKIELLESVDLSEGAKVLVTLTQSEGTDFWLKASQTALDAVWNNSEDDVYGQLLQK
jgi:hypothetical protein